MAHSILLADSDATNLELINTVLVRNGFVVLATPDGGDALARFFESNPDIVICAETLHGLGAAQLCKQIKQTNPQIHVILLRSLTTDHDEKPPCDAELALPFRFGALAELLEHWGFMQTEAPPTTVASVFDTLQAVAPPSAEDLRPETLAPAPLADHAPTLDSITLPLAVPALAPLVETLPELELTDIVLAEPAPKVVPKPSAVTHEKTGRLPPGVPRIGDLAQTPLPRIIFEMYLSTATGTLQLNRKGVRKTVHFRAGFPVRVDAQQLNENLGQMLIRHGRITQEHYDAAQVIQERTGCLQGQALIQIGALSETDLLHALLEQTEEKLAYCFSWRDGTYELSATDGLQGINSEVHPLKVIWRGVWEHYDLTSLMTFFSPQRQRYVSASDSFSIHYATLGPFLRHLNIEELLDGAHNVEGILRSDDTKAQQLAQMLYVLLATDMVRLSKERGKPLTAMPRRNEPATTPQLVAYGDLTKASDALARKYLFMQSANYFDILNINPNDTQADIEAAYKAALEPLRSKNLPPGLPDDILKRVREMGELLLKAREVLADPAQRQRYKESIKDQQVAQAPTIAPETQVSITSEISKTAESAIAAERIFKDGWALFQANQFSEARQKFEEAIRHDDHEATYRVALGRALLSENLGDIEGTRRRAAGCFLQALSIDPSHLDANLQMAKLLTSMGHAASAKPYLERILLRAPEHLEARDLFATMNK